ncbi:unnamed protein product [Urochloa humidicola]
MLSDLPDHILVCILERLRDDVRSLARTCALSRRWRTLFPPPLMLPELDISVWTFIQADDGSLITARLLHQATHRFTGALRFFLAGGGDQRRAIIKTLRLELYLIKPDYLFEACRLVIGAGEALRGRLELVILTGTSPFIWDDASGPENVRVGRLFAGRFMRLLVVNPAMFASSLKALALENLLFRSPSDVATLLGACAALENLTLDCCGFSDLSSVLAIDAPPSSRLKELYLQDLHAGGVRLVHAPRLEMLVCTGWIAASCPVTFGPGSAPCLEEMTLSNRARTWQSRFGLSELLLENAHPLEALRLGFTNDKIWVQPESRKVLEPAFSKLRILHLLNVFPEGDLSWTMFLLQAAPLLELVHIEVYHNHACSEFEPDDEREIEDLEWEVPPGFRHHHLRELRVSGGIDAGKKDVGFARLVVERALGLKLLVLDGRVTCEECVAMQQRDPSIVLSRFPEDKDGVDVMVRQIKGGISTSARIVVYSASNRVYEYRSNEAS